MSNATEQLRPDQILHKLDAAGRSYAIIEGRFVCSGGPMPPDLAALVESNEGRLIIFLERQERHDEGRRRQLWL
jgi:hypothetical protein